MTFLDMPAWIQVAIACEALALGWLTARFGWRGLLVGAAAAGGLWFVLGLAASFLVSRLEGGDPGGVVAMLRGAGLATLRLGAVAAPLIAAAAAIGGLIRWRRPRGPSPLAGEGGGEADG